MKIKMLSLLLFVFLQWHPSQAQKILMKITGISAVAGEEVSAVDFKFEATSTWGPTGITAGIVKTFPVLIKKSNGTSTNELHKRLSMGSVLTPNVVLEYYNESNVMYFRITMLNAIVSNFYWLSPECPTCIKLEHQVAFNPRRIETFDVSTGVTVGFDYQTKTTY